MFKEKLKKLWADDRPFSHRLGAAVAVALFLAYSLLFHTPLETFLSSPADFSFGFAPLAAVMGICALIAAVVIAGVLCLFRGLVFDVAASLLFSLCLGCYIQGNLMNGDVTIMNGVAVDWTLLTKSALIGLIVWAVLFAVPLLVRYFSRPVWQKVIVFGSAFFIIIQAAGLASLFFSVDSREISGDVYLSDEGVLEVGDENNVIVLLVDYFDNDYADAMLEAYPDVFDGFRGFTRFVNCSSVYKQTMPSIPYILTAQKWYRDVRYDKFAAPAFKNSTFLDEVLSAGASVDLYTKSGYIGQTGMSYATNKVETKVEINKLGLVKSMINSVLYRDMPVAMKSLFWYYTDDINNAAVAPVETDENAIPSYVIDDLAMAQRLENGDVSYYEDGRDTCFKFIHLMGGHAPYVMDENGQYNENTTAMSQYRGCFGIVSDYLDGLREIGAYDKSTVIIMADHGIVYVADELSVAPSPILFVKPANAPDEPMKVSSAPVSQEDFHATVLEALGADGSKYGRTFFDVGEDEERARNFYFRVAYDGSADEYEIEYEINGDVRDIANWHLTGNRW